MGVTERKMREKKLRRNSIVDAAETVFFSVGYDKATMDDVAAKAELSKGTLYLYFSNKEDLYHAIILRAFGVLEEAFSQTVQSDLNGIDKIKGFGEAYVSFCTEQPDYFKALIYHEHTSNLKSTVDKSPNAAKALEAGGRILGHCVSAIREGIEDGSIRPDVDPVKTAVFMWSATLGIIHVAHARGDILDSLFGIERTALMENAFEMIRKSVENPEP